MAVSLQQLLEDFVLPLHQGGAVKAGPPLGIADRERFAQDPSALFDPHLHSLRLRRASALMPAAALPDADLADLSLWMGMHNLLALDHPDRARIWARTSTWQKVSVATRALIHFAAPTDLAEQLARHVSVQCFFDLERVDQIARVEDQSRRFSGRPAPRAIRRMASIGELDLSEERLHWVEAGHAVEVDTLLPELLFVSPLTSLLMPTRAHASFEPRSPARWLRSRSGARAVVHRWAASDNWVGEGAAIMSRWLSALGREDLLGNDEGVAQGRMAPPAAEELQADTRTLMLSASEEHDLNDHAALLGALIHLHLLKVLAFDARVSLGGQPSRNAARAFLALPLMLPRLEAELGDPLAGIEDADALRRWDDYLAHLRGLVPLDTLENLVAALADPVVKRDAA